MNFSGNLQENMAKIANLKAKNPMLTHIYVKRVGMDGATIDIPYLQAEEVLRRHPLWVVESSNEDMEEDVAALFKEPDETEQPVVEIPPKPSEEVNHEGMGLHELVDPEKPKKRVRRNRTNKKA